MPTAFSAQCPLTLWHCLHPRYWAGGHFITVVREPTARVWSFYSYVRRKSTEFQAVPLLQLLRRWRSVTPNSTAAGGGSSPHWHWQL